MFPPCMLPYGSLHHQLIGRDKMSDEADIANENIPTPARPDGQGVLLVLRRTFADRPKVL